MTDLLLKLLKKAAITSVNKQDLHLQLLSHTDYPSLKSITDSLDYFGIENVAANVPHDALTQLPSSFLALIQLEDNNELVLVHQETSKIHITFDSGKTKKFKVDEFKNLWMGTIIAIEVPENISSKNQYHIPRERLYVVLFTLLILGIYSLQEVSLVSNIYMALSLCGLGISYLVVKEVEGAGNPVVAKVCGAITSDVKGCGTVINSAKEKFYRGLGLGDLSLMYFLSITVCSAILGVSTSTFFVIAFLSLPIIIYTLYTQAVVLKSWCVLCLGIAAVLLLQFTVLAISFSGWVFSLSYTVSGLLITTLVSMVWLLVKPLLESKRLLVEVQKDYLILKRDTSVLDAIINENKIEGLEVLSEDSQIFFGNRKGILQLTAYTNPLCGYCTEAFQAYNNLLSQFPEDVGVQFIFSTPDDATNPSTIISKRIVELYKEDTLKALQALKDWFSIKDLDLWKATHGESNSMLLIYDDILEAHRNVGVTNNINYTPETLIGASNFSRKHYDYNDIPLFINHLKEQKEEEPVTVSA
ncbi:vitamin K epoxide reductase family protein [uncultured Dokdonia sp.]|uniref:vitamin K epoxide reductase family protein n=1 Tax=Dokdonia sp. R78006 TaxID=3093866 RepID=UPI00261BFC14|nr:vitamin K epoxide reductase family protein [uncultured Dokdonia sp.]